MPSSSQLIASSTSLLSKRPESPLLGMSSVVLACMCSGFAGVFFEKLLKETVQSVAMRNIQLSLYGIAVGLIGVFLTDGKVVLDRGFFVGYDWLVWLTIFVQSLGGLLVAAVVRYADNILKGFATSAAIVINFVLSIFIFNFQLSYGFVAGALLLLGLDTIKADTTDYLIDTNHFKSLSEPPAAIAPLTNYARDYHCYFT
ncbi:unnamed protein product [Protopolystoma xenopodis]|uniref:EamA domain-containing protein n=1 Tax=Protopolystoma xenopodis TaxID=117903 RepID=A0A3S5B617_9PLAT|nr:unnamed protein product [Protopolystoma xenopodis]